MIRKPDRALAAGCRQRGFTLIEVLVALVIVGLGMMAVFGQLNQMLTATARLRDKTLATWIAVDRITELQANGEYPRIGERSDDLKMGRSEWTYTIRTSEIPGMDMRRVDVTVSYVDTPNDVLTEIAGFVRPPPVSGSGAQISSPDEGPPAGGFGQGFAPLDPSVDIGTGAAQ